MGIGDVTSKVLLEFKADTKQAKKELRGLTKEQKKAAKEQIAAMEKQNEKIEGQIALLGKVAIGVGAVAGAYVVLSKSAAAYAEQQQKIAQAGELSFKALADATTNLITEQQALHMAAQLNNGAFEITQQQMETAGKAAVILGQQTGDLEGSLNDVTQALVEGNVEALKKYGIMAEGTSDTVSGFNGIMDKLNEKLVANAGFSQAAGTEIQRAGNRWQDALDTLVQNLGRIAAHLAPIVEMIADAVHFWAEMSTEMSALNSARSEMVEELTRLRKQERAEGGLVPPRFRIRMEALEELIADYDRRILELRGTGGSAFQAPGLATGGGLGGKPVPAPSGAAGPRADRLTAQVGTAPFSVSRAGLVPVEIVSVNRSALMGAQQAGEIAGRRTFEAQGLDFALGGPNMDVGRGTPALEQILTGDVSNISAQTEAINALAGSFGGLQQAGSTAFEALITGSEGMGAAFRRAFAESLLGIASDMFGRSIWHAALAVGDLALGNLPGAAANAKAAAGFAAGAGVIGALAKGLHPDGFSQPAAPAGGSGGGIPGAAGRPLGGGEGGTREVIVIGMDSLDDDVRGKRRKMADLLSRANRELGKGEGQVRRS
jgi:hypothetical protein